MKIINLANSLILIVLIMVQVTVYAKDNWDFLAKIGLNFGGTMPRPMPSSISKVESYSPSIAPTIKVEALKWIDEKIGVSAGLSSENKGMKSTASVKEYSMNFGSNFNGRFKGTVDTEMNFNYLSFPILAHYSFTENLSVYAGPYYAYLLNGEFKGAVSDGELNNPIVGISDVKREKYDFSKDLRDHDAGLSIGLNFLPYNERVLLSFDFNYGLMSVFPGSFDGVEDNMQNVYAKLSIGYLF